MIAMPVTLTEERKRWWVSLIKRLLLIGTVVAVYGNSLSAPFIFDDRPAIVDNPTIRQWWGSWDPPHNGSSATGRPLVNMTFALNYAAGGLSVRGYHWVNLALHAWCALILYGLVARTLHRFAAVGDSRMEKWRNQSVKCELMAGLMALLWAVHPLLTESVTCVVQRNELLAGIFYLLTIYALERARESSTRINQWLVISVFACLAGVITKEVAATAPLIALLYDRTFIAGNFGAALRKRRWYYVALLATWVPLAFLVFANEGRSGTVGFGLGISSWEYLMTQARAVTLYVKLSLWPHPLVVDYGVPVVRSWMQISGRGIFILLLLGATLWALVRKPVAGFLGAWFFVILAPSSSVVPLTTQTIAEHRMYLPLIAVVASGVLLLRRISSGNLVMLTLPIVCLLAWKTVERNHEYSDEFTLWRQNILAEPENPRGYSNLGNAHVRRAEWGPAIEAYRLAVKIRPDFADAQSNLGNALLETGQTSEAIEHLRAAVSSKPDDADIRFNLGNGHLVNADLRAAISELQMALALRNGFTAAEFKLGLAELRFGQPAQAANSFERVLRTQPDNVEALTAGGNALLELGDAAGAITKYQSAIRLAPSLSALHFNLANVYLHEKRWPEAVAEYQIALNLDPQAVGSRHNLALALAGTGQHAEALQQAREAQRMAPENPAIRALVRQLEELR